MLCVCVCVCVQLMLLSCQTYRLTLCKKYKADGSFFCSLCLIQSPALAIDQWAFLLISGIKIELSSENILHISFHYDQNKHTTWGRKSTSVTRKHNKTREKKWVRCALRSSSILCRSCVQFFFFFFIFQTDPKTNNP